MNPMVILPILGALLVLPTILPLSTISWWWVRVWDFPRLQLAILYLVAIALLYVLAPRGWSRFIIACALVLCLAYQLSWIYAYLPIAPTQTQRATTTSRQHTLRIMVANILMTNRSAEKFLRIVQQVEPDILIVDEPDAWWAEQLRGLGAVFSHQTKYPLENTYGMIFFSRLPVVRSEVKFVVEDDVPSIHSIIKLRSGQPVELISLHPRPPQPNVDTEARDAELVLVGREVRKSPYPSIVAGDMNDVGWSHTSELFQKVSGLLDPRRGRGLYATFHAKYPFLRYPLDHLFHSEEFRLVNMTVLDDVGSDHFPLLVVLSYEPARKKEQEVPQMQPDDRELAREKIEWLEGGKP
jgi:endonuclease/exonuclease/phosphatase (EEP) superfamily protein YafD